MKSEAVIFYSWQSDHQDTRNYVENGILGAIKEINNSPNLEIPDRPAPKMDKDTQGEIGAVNIAKTIHDKIDKCDVFLADVTFVGELDDDKLVNQNVMYELGYALGKHGDSKIIMVANSDLGDPKQLPFDIFGRKVIQFSPTDDPKRKIFKKELKAAIEAHLGRVVAEHKQEEDTSLLEQLVTAIDNGKPVRTKAEKFFEVKYKDIAKKYPGNYLGGTSDDSKKYAKKCYEAFLRTKGDVAQIFEALSTAGEYKKLDVFTVGFQMLEAFTQKYDPSPQDNGTRYDVSSEFFGLIANEITQQMFGVMALNEMWFEMGTLAKIEHDRPYSGAKPALDGVYKFPTHINDYYKALSAQNWVYPALQYFKERWEDNRPILKAMSQGGLILFLVRRNYNGFTVPIYLLVGWEKYVPAYMYEFEDSLFIEKLIALSDSKDYDDLVGVIIDKATREIGSFSFEYYDLRHLFKKAGIDEIGKLGQKSSIVEAE